MSADAIFIGWQPGCGIMPDFPLFNLMRPVGAHQAGATVTAETLRSLGLEVPNVEARQTDLTQAGGSR